MLCQDYYRAEDLPAVIAELLKTGKLPYIGALTVNRETVRQNVRGKLMWDWEASRNDASARYRFNVKPTKVARIIGNHSSLVRLLTAVITGTVIDRVLCTF